jgi:hypothetical protein
VADIGAVVNPFRVAFGGALWVILSYQVGGFDSLTSADLITWTPRATAIPNIKIFEAFNNNYFFCGTESGVAFVPFTSPDGITWTQIAGVYPTGFSCGASDGTKLICLTDDPALFYVGISNAANSFVVTSLPYFGRINDVTFGNTIFVAIGSMASDVMAIFSSNGLDWNEAITMPPQAFSCIAFGNGIFVAGNNSVAGHNFAVSIDGSNWTFSVNEPYGPIISIAFGAGKFTAVGQSAVGNYILQSTDGLNWLNVAVPVTASFFDIASDNIHLVAVDLIHSVVIQST